MSTTALETKGKTETPIVLDSVDSLLSQAVKAGASIDTLERLMALRKEMQAEAAREAFNLAMAAFQAECPVIKKTKSVKTNEGKVAYSYAPIDSVIEQVKVLLQKHGFRYLVTMEYKDDKVKAICRITHTLGHEEISSFEVPLGNKTQIMSQSQVVAAASTFAKRYAFLNAFGIMTGDEDSEEALAVKDGVDQTDEVLDALRKCDSLKVYRVIIGNINQRRYKLNPQAIKTIMEFARKVKERLMMEDKTGTLAETPDLKVDDQGCTCPKNSKEPCAYCKKEILAIEKKEAATAK